VEAGTVPLDYLEDPVPADPPAALVLWGTIVAERLGHRPDTAVTLGRALLGFPAPTKSWSNGRLSLLGKTVFVMFDEDGELRAANGDQPARPAAARRYLERAFAARLTEVGAAMEVLAARYRPADLHQLGSRLYGKFKPQIPHGGTRWSAMLHVNNILVADES
jgi:hypothetical protein